MNIWVIKLECIGGCYLEEAVYRVCEIPDLFSLEELNHFILESFNFGNDNMHQFFKGRLPRPYGAGATIIENESLTLKDIFPLDKNKILFMHFDYGDDWIFKISRRLNKIEYNSKIDYPRVIEEVGKVDQYPSYEECN